jgi:cytochrome c
LPSNQILGLLLAAGLCLPAPALSAQSPSRSAASEVPAGKLVFGQRCAVCHFDESTADKIGPGLKGLYARGKFASGRKVDDAAVASCITRGGKDMPAYRDVLKPGQLQALVAYLKTL